MYLWEERSFGTIEFDAFLDESLELNRSVVARSRQVRLQVSLTDHEQNLAIRIHNTHELLCV